MSIQGWNSLFVCALTMGLSLPAFAGDPGKGKVVVTDGKNKVVVGAETDDGDEADVEVGDDEVKAGGVKVTGTGIQGTTTQVGTAEGKALTINGNAKKVEQACKADGVQVVVINGNSNEVTLTGECESVTISGNAQTVAVEAAGKIVVSGNANKVSYLRGLGSNKAPKIVKSGNANKVAVRKP